MISQILKSALKFLLNDSQGLNVNFDDKSRLVR